MISSRNEVVADRGERDHSSAQVEARDPAIETRERGIVFAVASAGHDCFALFQQDVHKIVSKVRSGAGDDGDIFYNVVPYGLGRSAST